MSKAVTLYYIGGTPEKTTVMPIEAVERATTYKLERPLATYGFRMIIAKQEAFVSPEHAMRGQAQVWRNEIDVLNRQVARLQARIAGIEVLEAEGARKAGVNQEAE